jgi:hypothetical protein
MWTEAKFVVADCGDIVDSGIELTLSAQSGSMNLATELSSLCTAVAKFLVPDWGDIADLA